MTISHDLSPILHPKNYGYRVGGDSLKRISINAGYVCDPALKSWMRRFSSKPLEDPEKDHSFLSPGGRLGPVQ